METQFTKEECGSGNIQTKQTEATLSAAAAAAAKSLQSCPTLCNPVDGNPPGSPVPEILQARILEWVAIAFSHIYSTSSQIIKIKINI